MPCPYAAQAGGIAAANPATAGSAGSDGFFAFFGLAGRKSLRFAFAFLTGDPVLDSTINLLF